MKKILTIDGGGIKGMYAASFLASIEKQLEDEGKEPRLYKYFDMMSGTSTGGIIAVGLALGIPAAQIASLYENKGPKIFDKHEKKFCEFWHKLKLNARHIYKTKYTPNELHAALREVLEDKVIGDAKTRLLIPSVHAVDNTPRNFKTKHAHRIKNDHKRLAVDVCMATAAAPTFFEAHKCQLAN